MFSLRGSVVCLAISLLTPALLTAQERGHVAGVFGWTFGEETAKLYGAQFGVGLGGSLSIIGGVEKLDDILTGRYALFLNEVASVPGVDITGQIPATYYGAGVRWTFPGMSLKPFAQLEAGGTSLSPDVMVGLDGDDVTDEIFTPGELDTSAFTIALGAGVRGNIGDHFLVEATFKFFNVHTEETIYLNRLSFAFGARF